MHVLNGELLRRPVRVLVVGCGGNGTAIISGLPYLHQAMLVSGHPGGLEVTVMDGDVVSPANCVRQPFTTSEVGLSKAVVMVSRVNLFWGLRWTSIPSFVSAATKLPDVDLIISCVDTRAARSDLLELVTDWRSRVFYWMDMGNSAASGQLVLGQPRNGRNRQFAQRLRTAAELFPEITIASLDADDGPSCSAIEALERQEPFVNQVLAQHALALLARLLRYGRIEHHGAFVDLASSRVQPLPVNPDLWRRMRRRGQRYLDATLRAA